MQMIDIVAEALRANNISSVKCTNRGKDFSSTGGLESFRNNASVRVLLMPLGLGAEGLDLIVASHVFLLEPLLNIHQELQAVNRISRLGQSKATFVHKYVVQGSIEENIVAVQERTRGLSDTEKTNKTDTLHHLHAKKRAAKGQKKTKNQHGDDDLLSEEDLSFILGLEAHRHASASAAAAAAASTESAAVVEPIDAAPITGNVHADNEEDEENDEENDDDDDAAPNYYEDEMYSDDNDIDEEDTTMRLTDHF
jgi:hypothetical protein